VGVAARRLLTTRRIAEPALIADPHPRRSMFHCLILTLVGAMAFAKNHAGQIAMAMLLNLAISTQQISCGGSTYAINSEISSIRLRAKAQSLGLVVNYVLGTVLVFVVPYMCEWRGRSVGGG
jgi:hypothetical protein